MLYTHSARLHVFEQLRQQAEPPRQMDIMPETHQAVYVWTPLLMLESSQHDKLVNVLDVFLNFEAASYKRALMRSG